MQKEEILFMDIPSVVIASLTEAKPRLVPAVGTTITEEQIRSSGARSLFELLDIHVPNLQWIRHHWEADHLGLRGIINDRDDKYLLLVNGRVMNDRTHYGALSERDLVLLKDIHHIDIVRGPGSSLYGPGAVSMVINIITHNAQTFEGTDVTTRLGAVEEFYSAEIRHGQKFDDDGGLFIYTGIGNYRGADKHDAPQVYAVDFPSGPQYDFGGGGNDAFTLPSDGYQAGDNFLHPSISNDGESHRNLPPLKLHAQINKDNWDIWARYTRGGQQFVWYPKVVARPPWGWVDIWPYMDWSTWPNVMLTSAPPLYVQSWGYQQATGYVGRKLELADNINVDCAFSYDMLDVERQIQNRIADAYREDEYYGKAVLQWQPNDRHKIAFGGEISHHELGLKSPGWPDDFARSSVWGAVESGDDANRMPRWSTNLYSLLGEWQWTISDKWTTFISARLDDHTFTPCMFSPRAAIIHTPTDIDTLKLIWSRSVRANFEEEMKKQADAGGGDSDPETLDSVEFRYERRHNKNLDLAASIFVHYNFELITYSPSRTSNTVVGTQRDYGVELEAAYHTESTCLLISHGYTKLYDFDLEPGQSTYVTSEPFGYGDDLANWSNHITKLTAQQKLDDKWSLDASLRIYWGFPGLKDLNRYLYDTSADPVVESGWEKAYRGNYYLNMGLQYQPNKNMTLRVDGLNLLGVFDKDLNKRNYYGDPDYRSHAAAVAVSMTYKF
ncbi:MAG: TonB-dependent receptor [Sedimentisphaerales bacterium]|nr:TonB-dependent receptor [Sedimentisphaerales bacterium]